ncbi:hypothetical protein N658DRAFT_230874 [Parathielavia hyrcaniae]|uniref:Secreted protein n=1 Tax=Parathielavia hyrcaniae TaxID=113614 RepID=A0AAN6PZF3_9PEZI|nr:hypothetical protein N658DRAFT_230874 [Parathielavia hyrcaniae]
MAGQFLASRLEWCAFVIFSLSACAESCQSDSLHLGEHLRVFMDDTYAAALTQRNHKAKPRSQRSPGQQKNNACN